VSPGFMDALCCIGGRSRLDDPSVFPKREEPTIGASKGHSFQNLLSCIGPSVFFEWENLHLGG
jgi:hypothetical protein